MDKGVATGRKQIPVSVIIPTRNRPEVLKKTLITFGNQTAQAAEIIIIDGSEEFATKELICLHAFDIDGELIYLKAVELGAATQRNQGFALANFPFILFADDDVYLEPDCLHLLFQAMADSPNVGGVSAMITNQKYLPMGKISSSLARLLLGKKLSSYAGKVIPPGWGMLPEDREDMPEVVEVEWLNLGATLYKKEALPNPPFQSYFKGYSMMEDLTLSVLVSKKWKLLNARTARIYHDSQPGTHKDNLAQISEMELANRHFIMTKILHRSSMKDYFKLFIFELFQLASSIRSGGARSFIQQVQGKLRALRNF